MITWDEAKRQINLAKHGIEFSQVALFDWERSVVTQDRRQEYGEVREIAFGPIGLRLYALVFTRRGANLHVISLRKANAREHRRYAQTIEKSQ